MTETQDDPLPNWALEKAANMAIPREEFLARFKARMLAVAGDKFDDGESIAEYADQTGPSYYDDESTREIGPEESADADISYWGE